MKKDKYLGMKIRTPKKGVLTVVGWETKGCRSKMYKLKCSLCSEDLELFPDYFTLDTSSLTRKVIPCGCYSKYRFNEQQQQVRVNRRCEELGYIFNGWVGEFKGVYTKINIYNPSTNNAWCTTDINSLINRGSKDPKQNMRNKEKNDSEYIKHFIKTGKFLEGTEFWRSDRKGERGRSYWKYRCPVCSCDEYVEQGLCSGVFEGRIDKLKSGRLGCRCAKGARLTSEQRQYQLNKILQEEESEFLRWEDRYESVYSVFNWSCSKGHECSTVVEKFLQGRRCPSCVDNGSFGYYPSRADEKDHLYLYNIKDVSYFKVGRSFEPSRRLKENQRRINNYYGNKKHRIKQTHLFTADHLYIYKLEQLLVGFENGLYDKCRPCENHSYGSSELINNIYYDEVIEFCEEYIEEWWK